MIFTLIKNEIIKILKRPKTWIVFGLFFLSVVGMVFISYKEDKIERYYTTPDGVIERLNREKEYYESSLKHAKEEGEDKKVIVSQIEEQIKDINKKIQRQEDIKANTRSEDIWKAELLEEKKDIEKELKDGQFNNESEESKKKRIEEIDKSIAENKRPIEEWEFNGINFGRGITETIGIVILILGIATFMSDIVSGESTPATLKFLLVQPISRGKVIFSKFIAVTLVVITMICGSELLGILGIGAVKGFDGADTLKTVGVEYQWTTVEGQAEKVITEVKDTGHNITRLQELVQIYGMQVLYIIACCAFVLLISTIFKSSMISMAVSLIISIASTILCIIPAIGKRFANYVFLNYGAPAKVIEGNVAYSFHNTNFSVSLGIIIMCIVIVVSYALSHIVFSKKDMLV